MGRIATPGGASERLVHLGSTSARDVEMTSEVTLEPAPASGIFAYDILRRQASGTHLRVGVHPLGGKLHFRGQTQHGESLFPDVDSGIAFTAGAYLLRVRVEGASPTRVRARVAGGDVGAIDVAGRSDDERRSADGREPRNTDGEHHRDADERALRCRPRVSDGHEHAAPGHDATGGADRA